MLCLRKIRLLFRLQITQHRQHWYICLSFSFLLLLQRWKTALLQHLLFSSFLLRLYKKTSNFLFWNLFSINLHVFQLGSFFFNFLFNLFDEFSIEEFSVWSIFNSSQWFISFHHLIQISIFSIFFVWLTCDVTMFEVRLIWNTCFFFIFISLNNNIYQIFHFDIRISKCVCELNDFLSFLLCVKRVSAFFKICKFQSMKYLILFSLY